MQVPWGIEEVSMEPLVESNLGRRTPRQYALTRLGQALTRLAVTPLAATVRFTDVNGPKGGADVRCAVVVKLPRQPLIRVERVATSARLAFDESCDRLLRRLERAQERRTDQRRHPKKYYTARRLL
jgi:ribosome-associated translation inhibitor RaiA